MSATTEPDAIPSDLVERAMALPVAAKRKLLGLLVEAVEGPPDDPELVHKEWQEVIADRIEGYLSGRYNAVDSEESYQRVLKKFLEDHPE